MDSCDVEVKTSTIPDAGKGLFARRPIQADERIATYGGVLKRGVAPSGDYVYMFPEPLVTGRLTEEQLVASKWRGTYRDAKTTNEFGRWINHDSRRANAYADIDGKDAMDGGWVLSFYARRNIEAGEEIFIDYGSEYTI